MTGPSQSLNAGTIHGDDSTRSLDRVYIIVVNWNGWRDVIECLESVFRLAYPKYTVVVCDNGSSDGSLDQIRAWARGELLAETRSEQLARLTMPPVAKPLKYFDADARTASDCSSNVSGVIHPLVLIQTGANLGFAGANNIGLRYALAQKDCAYLWLLNSDTVVPPDSLGHLLARMARTADAGICGSTLLYYDHPHRVQARGGSVYNPWTARGGHIGEGRNVDPSPDPAWVERRMRYVVGASMLVSRRFVESVGPMNERYFLYFEEVDWATRARGRFRLCYSPESIVYHKTGASIGSGPRPAFQSEIADYWGTKNRIVFTLGHFKYALPSVYLCVIGSALLRLYHRRIGNFRAVVAGALNLPSLVSPRVKGDFTSTGSNRMHRNDP